MPPIVHPVKRTYFRRADWKWMVLIAIGLGTLLWSWISPLTIPGPYGLYLGPLGAAGRYLGVHFPALVSGLVYFAGLTHLGEAAYAVYLCKNNNLTPVTALKWFGQTMCFGLASLGVLINYLKSTKRM